MTSFLLETRRRYKLCIWLGARVCQGTEEIEAAVVMNRYRLILLLDEIIFLLLHLMAEKNGNASIFSKRDRV